MNATKINAAQVASLELGQSSLFKLESLLVASTTSAAFTVNLTNAIRLWKYKLLDRSVKLVLVVLGFTAAATMLRYVVTYVTYTGLLLTNNFHLAFITNTHLCHTPIAIEMCPAMMLLCGPLVLCATQKRILRRLDDYKSGAECYKRRNAPYKFAAKTLLLLLIYSATSSTAMLVRKPSETELPLCDPLITMDTAVMVVSPAITLLLVFLAIHMLRKNQKLVLEKMNQYANSQSGLTVDQRVQIHRSHKLNKALLPGLAVQNVAYTIFLVSITPTQLLVERLAHRVMLGTIFVHTMFSTGALAIGVAIMKLLNGDDKVHEEPAGGKDEHKMRMQELDKIWCVQA